jgi:hypothetical protein
MTRREFFSMVSEAVIEDPSLLPVALEALSMASQNVADQHRGVKGYGKMVRFLGKLDRKLQDELDDANALLSE